MSKSRKYGIILLGATGYTGKLCAEHITKCLPTNLKWAVAGRSSSKLEALVAELKELQPDRTQPDVLPANLTKEDLDTLAKQTKVLLNCVGPYHQYSTPVVAACAENGTHYLDVTGETAWVREILHRYHETAKTNKAILIPEIGIESAPSDLIAFILTSTIRKNLNRGVRDVVCAVHEFTTAGASGGTLATAIGLLDHYSLSEIRAASSPYSLYPSEVQPPAKRPSPRGLLNRILGPFTYQPLGILVPGIFAVPNTAIVQRSGGLRRDFFGKQFRYAEFDRVKSYARGVGWHFTLLLISLVLIISPFRALAKRYMYQPGGGPERGTWEKDAFELRAIATAENVEGESGEKKAVAKLRYDGGMYYFTGVLLAEAAMVLLEKNGLVEELGGGLLTPSCLGQGFVDRLQKIEGFHIESQMME